MPLAFLCAAALAVDGDTLRCANVPEQNGRVRLARIDAPERGHQRGPGATAALTARLTGPVECREVDADPRVKGYQARDRYGRIVARCRVNGVDLGEAQVRSGWAKRWPR